MSASSSSEAREHELQLLSAMYALDEQLTISQPSHHHLHLAIRMLPRAGAAAQRYMEATLNLHLPPEYPDQPPAISLTHTKGLVDEEERSLLAHVRSLSLELVGECCAYELLEAGLSALTEMNCGGDCPICREELFPTPTSTPPTYISPCFHTFHNECIGQWWHAYTPNASSVQARMPSRAEAAAAALRAGVAELRQLEEKRNNCNGRYDVLSAQLSRTRALDPPAPQQEIRRQQEELLECESEVQRLNVRLERAETKSAALRCEAEALSRAEEDAASAEPLPCPSCRCLIPVSHLQQAGVTKLVPPLDPAAATRAFSPEGEERSLAVPPRPQDLALPPPTQGLMQGSQPAVEPTSSLLEKQAQLVPSGGDTTHSQIADSQCPVRPPGLPPGLDLPAKRDGLQSNAQQLELRTQISEVSRDHDDEAQRGHMAGKGIAGRTPGKGKGKGKGKGGRSSSRGAGGSGGKGDARPCGGRAGRWRRAPDGYDEMDAGSNSCDRPVQKHPQGKDRAVGGSRGSAARANSGSLGPLPSQEGRTLPVNPSTNSRSR
ncbi:MAG: hypothetical protein SGPRY_001214 [Prymnesium sp.]